MSTGTTPAESRPATEAAMPVIPKWMIHRRMYDWVLSLAHHKHANTALFLLSFAESSFFPIPPDVLQIALTLERRSRAFFYAALSTAASTLGGIFGWVIGLAMWSAVGELFFKYVPGFTPENFALVQSKYEENAFLAIFTAAFTPIPYKVFTIASGVFEVSLATLVVASLIGRGMRFFMVALVFWLVGPPAKRLIEKYFNLLTVVFTVLLIAGFVVIGSMGHDGEGADEPEPAQVAPAVPTPAP